MYKVIVGNRRMLVGGNLRTAIRCSKVRVRKGNKCWLVKSLFTGVEFVEWTADKMKARVLSLLGS
jgi:hypothetical protein